MATAQSPSRMSRLGIFTSRQGSSKPGPSSPLTREPEEQEEDWYIPYNGPYEPPKRHTEQSQEVEYFRGTSYENNFPRPGDGGKSYVDIAEYHRKVK